MGLTNYGELASAISTLVDLREQIDAAGGTFAAEILDIAVLELKTQLHGISTEEMDQFINVLHNGLPEASHGTLNGNGIRD